MLSLVLGATDTPALRRLRAQRGVVASEEDTLPIPGVATADETVAEAIANLTNGPTWFVGEQLREGAKHMGALSRSELVRMMHDHPNIMDRRDDAAAAS